jgi:hypothetical protein
MMMAREDCTAYDLSWVARQNDIEPVALEAFHALVGRRDCTDEHLSMLATEASHTSVRQAALLALVERH